MSALCIEAATFVRRTGCTSVYTAKKAYQELSTVERGLYPQVLRLLKVLLVCPVPSAACERSYSGLRRLKTWLRNTLAQERLNYNIVCSIHKELLMDVSLDAILRQFISRTEIRRNMFGTC